MTIGNYYTCPNCGEPLSSNATVHTCPFPIGRSFTVTFPQTTNPNNAPDTLEQRIEALEHRVAEFERVARQAGFYD